MKIISHLTILPLVCLVAAADTETDQKVKLEEAALTAGIDKDFVINPKRRAELIEALRRRIKQGYLDENIFRIQTKRDHPSKVESAAYSKPYFDVKAKGFDRALFLASEFRCVELVPLLVQLGDMAVLNFDIYRKNESAPAVKAIVAMGPTAIEPLFKIVERSSEPKERYYALMVLKEGQQAWKAELNGKGLAERMEEQCDIDNTNVQLALALLKGKITHPSTAAGWDDQIRSR